MPFEVPVTCRCGSLRATAREGPGDSSNRVVCYCDDCQAFAHFLDQSPSVLDDHGGTEILQMSAGRVDIVAGVEQLRCIQLTEKGLLRWYAGCCRTPMGNTPATRQIPIVGLIHSGVAPDLAGTRRDECLGPIRARVQARYMIGDRQEIDAVDGILPLRNLFRFMGIAFRARWRGDHKRTPFFSRTTGEPVSPAKRLTEEEQDAAYRPGA